MYIIIWIETKTHGSDIPVFYYNKTIKEKDNPTLLGLKRRYLEALKKSNANPIRFF